MFALLLFGLRESEGGPTERRRILRQEGAVVKQPPGM
jgi:hypothetical protein